MNRVEFLMQGLELNEVQASLVSELIADIPNNQLKNFLVFRMKFIEPYKSKELITKEALYEYRRIQIEQRLQAGEKVFNTLEEMVQFIELHYKGKELGYGLGSYYDFVVLALDRDCNLINKYHTTDAGNYYKLKSDEKAKVYDWLFEHQDRIGVIRYIPYYDPTPKLEAPKTEVNDDYIDPKVLKMMSKHKKLLKK